jgi:hypothetical protein
MKGTATFPNGTKYVGSVRAPSSSAPAHLDTRAAVEGRPEERAGYSDVRDVISTWWLHCLTACRYGVTESYEGAWKANQRNGLGK